MLTTVNSLFQKDVIDITDGKRLGQVVDLEINTQNGQTVSMLIREECGFSMKKPPVFQVLWQNICVIGESTVLVNKSECKPVENGKKSFLKLFSK